MVCAYTIFNKWYANDVLTWITFDNGDSAKSLSVIKYDRLYKAQEIWFMILLDIIWIKRMAWQLDTQAYLS